MRDDPTLDRGRLPQIDPDVTTAASLPGGFYDDPAIFALQREQVFARSWQLLPTFAALDPKADSFAAPVTLPGCASDPLLLTRASDGTLRCLSNVCTHRGNLLVTEPGPLRALRCRYHGRRFGLDGQMLGSPHFEAARNFPSPADDLPNLPLGHWGPLVFASFRPASSFDVWSAPLRAWVEFLGPQRLAYDAAATREYEVAANWALYCDNYLEGFHIPFVHPELSVTLDLPAYQTELLPQGTLQVGTAATGQPAFDLPRGHPHHGQRIGAYYLWLFPNTMCNVYPWGLSVNIVRPLAVDRTAISFLTFVADPSLRGQGAGADLHTVELQDEDVVASVQQGVRSRLYHRGRYSPAQEAGVHHFHRMLLAALAG